MEEDGGWEDAAFNTRHLHNRNDRGGQPGNTRHEFHVRNTFGTHLLKCAALERLQQKAQSGSGSGVVGKGGGGGKTGTLAGSARKRKGRANSNGGEAVLEVYRLTDNEDGVLGSLRCAGILEATAVFAGSRKTLGNITRHLERAGSGQASPLQNGSAVIGHRREAADDDTNGDGDGDGDGGGGDDDDDDDQDEEEDEEDDDGLVSGEESGNATSREHRQRRRVATFEKNSFRQPKFWFRWQGLLGDDVEVAAADTTVRGSGYVVFSGNDCRRFQGTMTSEQLGWNNVKMTGWKAKPQPERDFEIQWSIET